MTIPNDTIQRAAEAMYDDGWIAHDYVGMIRSTLPVLIPAIRADLVEEISNENAHADREQEAAIRFRIAQEIRGYIDQETRRFEIGFADSSDRWRLAGLFDALRIIERGTGVAGEGEG